jgi:hypothetical protein
MTTRVRPLLESLRRIRPGRDQLTVTGHTDTVGSDACHEQAVYAALTIYRGSGGWCSLSSDHIC